MNARQARWRVLVGEGGAVMLVEVRQSSGSRELDDTFTREEENTRYLPALLDGAPITMWIDRSLYMKRR
jgi:outer membrane biosynthesis protein TonB